jgi:sulfur carrier protein
MSGAPGQPPGDGTTITIRLNGEERRVSGGLSLQALLPAIGYQPRLVVVEFTGEILPRERWGAQPVVESDALEVVTIVGGGS